MSNKSNMEKTIDAAIMAKKMSAIAKAAAVAGIKGAALQAAKEFSPQLVKAVIIILILLLLIPFLIVSALPNIFFGYSASSSEDITAMTNQAKTIESAYKSTQDYNEKEIKQMIENISTGYDDVQINDETGSLNHYWFIAICSVAYNQDLFAMNEQDIRFGKILGFPLFTLHTSEEEYTQADGEQIKTLKRLKVNVKDIEPEELMNKLSFTGAQKNWAKTIYNTMSDNQMIKPGDPSYVEGTLADYGDVKFTQGSTEVVYYNQGDARWGSKLYGKYDTIKDCGCGSTSLAIVVSSFTDTMIDPKQMSDWAYENGYCVRNSGSLHSLIPNGAKHFGLRVEGATRYEGQKIADALANGKLVVAIMGKGHFTTAGHFMVLRGVTSEGKILVADPGSYKNTGKEWDLSIILNESRRGAAAGGPFWIISP